MLYQFGGVQFTIAPLNTHETNRASTADFVEKPIYGAKMPLEYVGDGTEIAVIIGRIFPKAQGFGGLGELAALQEMRASGEAYMLVRGDGTPLGWFVIEAIREASHFLAFDGVGQVVEFELALKRDISPAGGYSPAIMSLF